MPRLSRLTPSPVGTRTLAVASLAVAGVLALAGCGNNGVAQESNEHNGETAANGQVGDVLVRDAQITVGPDAGSGSLALTLFEQGQNPDTLTAVTSPRAESFTLPSGPAGSTASPAAATTTAVTLPVMAAVTLESGSSDIGISGLTGAPLIGDSIPVTFTFAGAGSLTLDVPVTDDANAAASPAPSPTVSDANIDDGPSGS